MGHFPFHRVKLHTSIGGVGRAARRGDGRRRRQIGVLVYVHEIGSCRRDGLRTWLIWTRQKNRASSLCGV